MARADLNKYYTLFIESLKERFDWGKGVAELLLSSSFCSTFLLTVKHLETIQSLGESAEVATGAANVTLEDIPHVGPPGSSQPSLHKRPATATECENTAVRSTRLGPSHYSYGIQYTSRDDLWEHIESNHPGNNWKCSDQECDKVYSDRDSLWKHYRIKHMDIYDFICDLCDEFGHEEEETIKYHIEIKHDIPSDIRCVPCNKHFPQKNKLEQHLKTCGHKLKHLDALKETLRRFIDPKHSSFFIWELNIPEEVKRNIAECVSSVVKYSWASWLWYVIREVFF